jgi:hypothetical protein
MPPHATTTGKEALLEPERLKVFGGASTDRSANWRLLKGRAAS